MHNGRIPNFILTFVYLVAAVYKMMQHLKERLVLRSLTSMRDSKSMVPPITFLFRDTIIFYLVTFGIGVINVTFSTVFSSRILGSVGLPWFVATYSIAGSRLLLMLKGDINNQTSIYKTGSEYRIEPASDYKPKKKRRSIFSGLRKGDARDSHTKHIDLATLRSNIQVV
ncbi:hypothetical protein BU17DRAFT_85511 [Hysterangium stoloniferum]|nr:hypothetical protein BU17DRAFT_85511 [Hysterangium stoloniferum]